jgi:hypothetical protein
LFYADGRTVRETDRQIDRYDEANSRFPQISLTRLKTGFSGGRGLSVCMCVCFRRACPFKAFTNLTDFQETKLNIMNFWDNPLLVATPLKTKINLLFLCKIMNTAQSSRRGEPFVTK